MNEKLFYLWIGLIIFLIRYGIWIVLGIVVADRILDYFQYMKSSYYKVTKNKYFSVMFDKGKLGEYYIYKHLKKLEKNNAKFLFNIYVPKENGETTEIDVLMITTKGIFVFESKNYSGWIFGSELQKYWTQTLPQGKGRSLKEKFFNPIMQNTGHIKHLKNIIGEDIEMHSIITFSNRCTFKKLYIKSPSVEVIHRQEVMQTVKKIMLNIQVETLNSKEIQQIYDRLYFYTQVSTETKQQHIQNINSKN